MFRRLYLAEAQIHGPHRGQRRDRNAHSFRFFGLVFIVPASSAPISAEDFATVAAYCDFATGVLALLALALIRTRPLVGALVVAYNVVGVGDLLVDYYDATMAELPAVAGEFGGLYAIPIIYVPIRTITHIASFYLLLRAQRRRACAGIAAI